MDASEQRRNARHRRRQRVRKSIRGSDTKPRLSVFRSNKHLYVQVISDQSGRTLAAASTLKGSGAGLTRETAKALGSEISDKCKALGIAAVVFDRNGFAYHGRVQALAEAAREGGLEF